MYLSAAVFATLALLPFSLAQNTTDPATKCTSFTFPTSFPEGIAGALVSATYYPANAAINFSDVNTALATTNISAFCRLQINVSTFPGSQAKSEIWLPDSSAWNKRTWFVGNGASGGGIDWGTLGYGVVNQGFAGHATNAGHSSNGSSAAWAQNNTGAVIDLGYRAMHYGTVIAKTVISNYYGQNFTSIYGSCSAGGRQGWMAVQRYPYDYDVVLVGSPGLDDVRQSASALWVNQRVLPVNGTTWFSNSTWALVNTEVLRQCDALDGLADGVLSNPDLCRFRPQAIACKPGQEPVSANGTANCLTFAQLNTLRYVYEPWVDVNDTFVYAGFPYGGELGFVTGNLLPDGGQYGQDGDFFRWLVANSSSWTVDQISYQYVISGVQGVGTTNSATNPNITEYVNKGGKVVQYVGWQDKYISPYASIDWVNTVDTFMSTNSNKTLSDYLRLFIVPGMGHCAGGNGPNNIGQPSSYSATSRPVSQSPQNNMIFGALNWFENGTAPDSFIGTSYRNNRADLGVGYQRPICQYPKWARYNGNGDPNSATSFTCVL